MAELKDRPARDRVALHLPSTSAQFFVRADGPAPLIEVAGELDLSNADALDGCLSVFDAGDAVILDLANLTYLDSRGLAVLAQTGSRGVALTCRGARGSVRRVIELCGLDAILTLEH